MSLFPLQKLPTSPLYQVFAVLSQAMQNQSVRATVVTQNYVNASSTGSTPGSTPYQRQRVFFKNCVDGRTGVHMPLLEKIDKDPSVFPQEYHPGHPAANSTGMVLMPNVKPYEEITDFQEATQNIRSCSTVYKAATVIVQRLHDLMKN